jgi:ABC-2 type transport system ATP-binding protein
VVDVGLHRPTLDDVFLSLTGHTAEQVSEDGHGVEPEHTETQEKEAVR